MERIRFMADMSIRRACGFGLIAIATAMTGMSHDVRLAMRGGALMFMIMGAILLWKALRAGATHYRRTEVWILLDGKLDWPEHRRQELIGNVLRERYMWHAEMTAFVAAILWASAFLLGLLRG
jgi:hypothetical protein